MASKINFVTPANWWMASYRYRAHYPSNELNKHGLQSVISQSPIDGCDVYIFSKLWESNADQMKKVRGVRVYDICDDHFNKSGIGDEYRKLVDLADVITCNSDYMAVRIKEETGRIAVVIEDPYESPLSLPRSRVGKPKLVWFGHQTNLKLLDRLPMDKIAPLISGFEVVSAFDQKHTKNGVIFTPWSIGAQRRAIADADIVVIPQDGKAKSANRLIESLRLGRFVCADPIPSYLEFADYAWIGDIAEGIRWAAFHPEEVAEKIRNGQGYIEKYSQKNIGDKWKALLSSI